MTESGGNIEKLLERYVLDELSADDRRLVEQYLTDVGEDAARARLDLRFENVLLRSLTTECPEHDVAGAVLDRVFRRPGIENRRHYRPDLAVTILEKAREEGRIGPPRQRVWAPRVRQVAGLAAGFLFFAVLLWSTTLEPDRGRLEQGAPGRAFDVALVGDVSVLSCAAGSTFDGIPDQPIGKTGRPLRIGDEITTDADEIALLRVDDGHGRVAILPFSRVRVTRSNGPGSQLALRVLEGGFHYDFSAVTGSIPVETDNGHRGKIQGQGEFVIASRSVGGQQPALESSLGQIVLVRVSGDSFAVFDSPQGKVRIRKGQLGIVGPESAVAVTESSLTEISTNLRTTWRVDDFLKNATEPALEVPGAQFNRADMAAEALRVYKYDLIELLAASFVVEVELDRLGITPTQTDYNDATNFVRSDELMQVLPLRAEEAVQRRCRQIAGLLAIDRDEQMRRGGEFRNEPVALVRQRVWPRLASKLNLRRGDEGQELAFEFSYREKTLAVNRSAAWAHLRQFLRVSELDRLIRQFSERSLITTWLEKRGDHWRGELPAFAAQFVAMAQMTGMSRVQLQDSIQIAELIQSVVQPPSGPELERFMLENVTKRRSLVYEQWFLPTTDPYHGFEYDATHQATAKAQADRLVASLRAGKPPELPPPGPRLLGSIWKNGTAGGPRPWWSEIYGRDFGLVVANLSVGQVSDPIRSPEGWHVVRLVKEGQEQSDPRAHRSFANQLYRYEMARRLFENIVARESRLLFSPADLLR